MTAFGMKGQSCDPVSVSLATHNELSVGDCPYFPSVVIAGGGYDAFPGMHDDLADSHHMSFEGLVESHSFETKIVVVYLLIQ